MQLVEPMVGRDSSSKLPKRNQGQNQHPLHGKESPTALFC
jgi:hypothetical protein